MATTRLDYRVADLRQQVRDRCDREVAKAAERRDNANRLTKRRNHTPVGESEPVVSLTPKMLNEWLGL